MPGPLLPIDPIDMTGHGGLRVEVHRDWKSLAVPGPVGVQVMGTDDGKTWVTEGLPVVLNAPGVAVARIRRTQGLLRFHAEVPEGGLTGGLTIRFIREP